ncbi:hypothetical protein DPMN_193518 [Dreissena polymorpha]|uniref:Uncharacterized protein n=1 Tax=Dreissena polymorpha TaxID=45954 RepID=A0A9D3XZT3_DREPO|nr:hypothetical protein DPMN_193518 [Dreissena polymorpha]
MCAARALTVVSTNWLKGQLGSRPLKRAPRDLRVLDVSFSFDSQVDTYKEAYMSGHIPSSVHFDILKCVTSTPEIPCNLPNSNCFPDYM